MNKYDPHSLQLKSSFIYDILFENNIIHFNLGVLRETIANIESLKCGDFKKRYLYISCVWIVKLTFNVFKTWGSG